MKFRMSNTFVLILVTAVVLFGCGRSNLFEPTGSQSTLNNAFNPSGEVRIAMEVTGGFAGIHQSLTIDANGYTIFTDSQRGDSQITLTLSAEELGSLVSHFLQNDFLHLSNRYVQENTADAFNYDLYFNYAGSSKRVKTDNLEVPANLRAIITRLTELAQEISENALTLELALDREVLRAGETVRLTLTATNNTAQALQLTRGGQKFDFFALPASEVTQNPQSRLRLPEPAWHWSFEKAFIAIFENISLAPGETLQYSVTWDGKGNNGEMLAGAYFVGAQLVGSPGGITALRDLSILK